MKIGVMSDLHLGARQYGLEEREEDFYRMFRVAINDFFYADVDLVIIAGDIFDKSRPSPKALKVFSNGIRELSNHGIDVVNVVGNHAMIQSSQFVTADEFLWSTFEDNDSYGLLDVDNIYHKTNSGVNIFGLPYHYDYDLDLFKDKISYFSDIIDENPGMKNILVVHQGFQEFCGYTGEELSINDIPFDKFDLIICGHIHERKLRDLGNGTVFLQPGSIERMNLAEARDEEVQGKGIYFIDTDNMDVESIAGGFHRLYSPRRFYIANMYINSYDEIEEIKNEITDEIKACSVPPVLFLSVHDTSESFDGLMNLTVELQDMCLIVRFKYFDESVQMETSIEAGENMPTPREALQIALNPLSVEERKFALALYDALKDGEDVTELVQDFEKKRYDQHTIEYSNELKEHEEWIKEVEEFFDKLS